jgi:hypothetical protein
MKNRRSGALVRWVTRVIGGAGIVAAFFFVTLVFLDYFTWKLPIQYALRMHDPLRPHWKGTVRRRDITISAAG